MAIFQTINSIIFLVIAFLCFFKTNSPGTTLGISFVTAAGRTDFRATYAGMCLAVGIFFILPYLTSRVTWEAATWLSAVVYFGFASTRLYGILTEGPQTRLMYIFFATELTMGIISVLFLKRQ